MTAGTVPAGGRLSAYDESVPGPPQDEVLAERFADIRDRRRADPAVLDEVHDLVLVVSSSRGGSTLLAEILRGWPDLVGLPGEVNPYVVVAQLGASGRREALAGELAADLGRPADTIDVAAGAAAAEDFALQCAWRMAAQWPGVPLGTGEVTAGVDRVLADVPDVRFDDGGAAFTARLLDQLGGAHRGLDLRRYDVPGDDLGKPPTGPPADPVVEMTPYRLLRPWARASAADLRGRPVVLATPRNSFRIAHLASLFPQARLRLLHLTRNPAASVNGLVDGWLHHGFFNCRVDRPLSIRGYTDRFPGWGREWWKYDVPPGWEQVTDAPLPEVAALQWRTAHEAVLEAVLIGGYDVHRLSYEDLVGPPEARERVGRELGDWLGIGDVDGFTDRVRRGLAPVMATAPPAPGRWRRREADLAGVVADRRVLDVAETLGYPRDPDAWL